MVDVGHLIGAQRHANNVDTSETALCIPMHTYAFCVHIFDLWPLLGNNYTYRSWQLGILCDVLTVLTLQKNRLVFRYSYLPAFDLRTHDMDVSHVMDDRIKVQFVSQKGNTTVLHRLQINLIGQWVKVQHKTNIEKLGRIFYAPDASTNKEKVVGLHCIGPYSVPRWEIPVGWKQRFLVLSREAEDTTHQCQLKKHRWLGHASKFLHKV